MTLADEIEERIRLIPARNPGYLSVIHEETLEKLLDGSLLRRIALEAADVAARSRLIAAAPDLLEALQEMVAVPIPAYGYTKQRALQCEKARAAIAKATGN